MMSFKIRLYEDKDFETIHGWWIAQKEFPPNPGMLGNGSTFVLEMDGVSALCVSLYLTNTKEVCWVENFVGNPELKGNLRREASQALSHHIDHVAKELGYKRMFCMGKGEKLCGRYEELGYHKTIEGVSTFAKEL